jgi:DNA repair protein RadC
MDENDGKKKENGKDTKKKNVHSGHRQRMRERFMLEGDFDNFQYHEVLEMILYYSYARMDTNKKAHELLDIYGSFANLLNSPPQDLMNRAGLSESSAVLISMLPHIARKYFASFYEHGMLMQNVNIVAGFFKSRLCALPKESFYVLFLDKKYRYIKDVRISTGDGNQSFIMPAKVVELALLYKAEFVILGHNHPAGIERPSKSDISATELLSEHLQKIDVKVVDHIIICGENRYYSFERRCCFTIKEVVE